MPMLSSTSMTDTEKRSFMLIDRFCKAVRQSFMNIARAEEDSTSIPIKGVKPQIFRHLLYYVYGGTISNETLKDHANEIIDAADRFGIGHLKVVAEASYVKSHQSQWTIS